MMPRPDTADAVSAQGNYAGAVSRFLAYAVDLGVSTAVFTLALAGVGFVVHVITNKPTSWNRSDPIVIALFVVWQFVYFGYSWAVASRSFGMYVLGLRVVRADGTEIAPRAGVIRALVFPLSFLLLGLGFLGILVQHERRALHDLIAGTTVIYSWNARAARLHFLAREGETGALGPRHPDAGGRAADDGAVPDGAAAGGAGTGGVALDGQARPAQAAQLPGRGPGTPRP
ncbi:MAG: RDD family protein [Streptosporangiaceae bacterium]